MFSLLFAVLIPVVLGQHIFPGKCEKFVQETKQNFDAAAYLGKWYENGRYETIFQKGGDCVTATYSTLPDGTIGVVNEMLYLPNKEPSRIEGFAIEQNPGANDGKLLVKFPISPQATYWVVDTDYRHFSVVWSCYDLPGSSIQFLWILTRENIINSEIQTTIDEVLKKNHLNKEMLRKTTTGEDQCGIY